MIQKQIQYISKVLTIGLFNLGIFTAGHQALAAPAMPKSLKPAPQYKALALVEVTSTEFPHLKAGFVTDTAGKEQPALLSTGTQPMVWLAAKPILNIFKCAKKACANDAQGNVYELNGKQWKVFPDQLRPWTTQVHYHKALTACTKPTVTPHKGVEGRCYAGDNSWILKYDIAGPKPTFCSKDELRMIQSRAGKKSLLIVSLPNGKPRITIPVTPPYKPLCDYPKSIPKTEAPSKG